MGYPETRHGRTLAQIQTDLAQLLKTCPKSAPTVARILDLLSELVGESAEAQTAGPGRGSDPGKPRGAAVLGYAVQQTPRGPMLVERRYDNPKDFRCSRAVYSATARSLQDRQESVDFEQVLHTVGEALGYQPADYLCRICLRFWISRNPPLVLRSRARYRATQPAGFVQQADRAWRDLEKTTATTTLH